MPDIKTWTNVIVVKKTEGLTWKRKSSWKSLSSFKEGKGKAGVTWDSPFSFQEMKIWFYRSFKSLFRVEMLINCWDRFEDMLLAIFFNPFGKKIKFKDWFTLFISFGDPIIEDLQVFCIPIFKDAVDSVAAENSNLDSLFILDWAGVNLSKDISKESSIYILEIFELIIRTIQMVNAEVDPKGNFVS